MELWIHYISKFNNSCNSLSNFQINNGEYLSKRFVSTDYLTF